MRTEIPGTGGLQLRVPAAAYLAGLARSVVETPFEYAKVKGQTRQQWKLSGVYKGLPAVSLRCGPQNVTYLTFLDIVRRKTNLMESKPG